MEHLKLEESVKFVTLNTLTEEDMAFTRMVNTHLQKCEKCRKMIRACQMANDKLQLETIFKELEPVITPDAEEISSDSFR